MSSSKLLKSKSLTIFLCQKLDMAIKCFEVLRTVLQNSELFFNTCSLGKYVPWDIYFQCQYNGVSSQSHPCILGGKKGNYFSC